MHIHVPFSWFWLVEDTSTLPVNHCGHVHFHLPGSQNPAPKQTKINVNGKEPLETTTPLLTQSTVWQDMSRPLYSGCEQDTVACERTWSELASWTLHSAIAKKRNRRSATSSRTVPSGGNRDTSYGRRMSQPPTSCGERRRPAPHHPIPGNMWNEGLGRRRTRPQKNKKKNCGQSMAFGAVNRKARGTHRKTHETRRDGKTVSEAELTHQATTKREHCRHIIADGRKNPRGWSLLF